MSGVTVEYHIDTSDALRLLDEIKTKMKSYAVPLTEGATFLQRQFGFNFDSQGSQVGGWPVLSPVTAAYRIKHGLPGPGPMLVETGALKAALFGMRPRIGFRTAEMSVTGKVAKFHQYGTVHMPAREIMFVPKGFAGLMARKTLGHILPGPTFSGLLP